jgi:hypothetical protein
MIATRDFRRLGQAREITLTMSLDEFRETVEWLETADPHDRATADWRDWLDHVDPAGREDA